MPVIGTAGHVDHGKSAILERLTGKNPMHLREEFDRGLTIELGFGYWRSPSGIECGMVDVPGHGHFIRNMAGGAFALDAVIFVVAADDGWKPQSEEHLFICNNANIKRAVVVINKCDLVSKDRLDELRDEFAIRFEGTFLENAPVIEVSAFTGAGIKDLESALDNLLHELPQPVVSNKIRIWIDRSFKIGGAGIVITGTIRGGVLRTGDSMTLFDGNERMRVRKLEMYGKTVETAQPNNRLAVNLTGSSKVEPQRGSLLSLNFDPKPVREITTFVQIAPTWESGIRYGGNYLAHIGTRSVETRVYPYLKKKLDCGASGICRMSLADPVPVEAGDRFVLFSSARHGVVGGCLTLFPDNLPRAIRHNENLLKTISAGGLSAETYALLRAFAEPVLTENIHIGSTFSQAEIKNAVATLVGKNKLSVFVYSGQEIAFEKGYYDSTVASSVIRVDQLRKEIPNITNISPTQINLPVRLHKIAIAVIMETLASKVQGFEYRNGVLELKSGSSVDITSSPVARGILARFKGDIVNFPTLKQLYQMFPRDKRIIATLLEEGALVKLPQDILLPPNILKRLRNDLDSLLRKKPEISVADIKDIWGVTRKHAIPLLEYFDSISMTERRGDVRVKGINFEKH